jgi:hypothetical protein
MNIGHCPCQYSANGTKIGESTASPFSFTWNNVPQGNYTVSHRH